MTKEQVVELVVNAVREVCPDLGGRAIGAADSLQAMGVDSVDRAEIVMHVLERMDLRLPLVETYGPKNIGELAELLSGKLAVSEVGPTGRRT